MAEPTTSDEELHREMPTSRALELFIKHLTSSNHRNISNMIVALEELPNRAGQNLDAVFLPSFRDEELLRSLFPMAQRQGSSIANPFLGLIDLFETRPNVRRTQLPRSPNAPTPYYPCSIPAVRGLPPKHLFPLSSELRRDQGSPAFVNNVAQFRRNFDLITNGAFSNVRDWQNIVVAGGAIIFCATTLSSSLTDRQILNLLESDLYVDIDIDIFIHGLDVEEAKDRMKQLYQEIDSALRSNSICVRKSNTITIYASWPYKSMQIVLRLYQSLAEILAGFDVDATCFAYNGTTVYTNPRGLASVIRQSNTVDIHRRSPSYEFRLAKYADRGFEVYLPELEREKIDYSSLGNRAASSYPNGLARIIILEVIRLDSGHYNILSWPIRRPVSSDRPGEVNSVENLLESDYDTLYYRIGHGRQRETVNARNIQRDIEELDIRLNSTYNPNNFNRRLHRHAAFGGTMEACLGAFCPACPVPVTAAERALVASEKMFIRGPVKFLQNDPGRQTVGSINPIDPNGWYLEAYQAEIHVV